MACFAAESAGLLAPYVKAVMWEEWAEGRDIGQTEVLLDIASRIGLDGDVVEQALNDASNADRLSANWAEASGLGVIGVPTFIVGEEIFWGNDRLDFVEEHLAGLGLTR